MGFAGSLVRFKEIEKALEGKKGLSNCVTNSRQGNKGTKISWCLIVFGVWYFGRGMLTRLDSLFHPPNLIRFRNRRGSSTWSSNIPSTNTTNQDMTSPCWGHISFKHASFDTSCNLANVTSQRLRTCFESNCDDCRMNANLVHRFLNQYWHRCAPTVFAPGLIYTQPSPFAYY